MDRDKRWERVKLAKEKLGKIEGVSFVFLDEKDVLRHKLVKKIIKAYK